MRSCALPAKLAWDFDKEAAQMKRKKMSNRITKALISSQGARACLKNYLLE
ncbi:MAG: hypothetical protein M3139_03610 [Bacteroidota bacterium]|nr:hypothetical protein [Bacteroidota bacterium]